MPEASLKRLAELEAVDMKRAANFLQNELICAQERKTNAERVAKIAEADAAEAK